METRREISAGGVVYRRRRGKVQVALAARRTRRGDLVWGLAKGAIEPDETPESAAIREVREETGLHARIQESLGEIRYFYVWEGVRVRKLVHFFLMRVTGGDVAEHDEEMEDVRWFPLAEAAKSRRLQGRAPGHRASRRAALVTPWQWALGAVVGFCSGVLSGLFGVGGGVVTTPAVNVLLGGTAIQAIATPLPVIFPTSLVGAFTYARAGEVSLRAARWAIGPGVGGAIAGALLTDLVNAHLLLMITSVIIAWTAVQLIRGRTSKVAWEKGKTPGWKHASIGLGAGFVSGLLGVGGGIVMVPAFTVLVGMPLKRALGTSLVVIAALVVPGTIVHALARPHRLGDLPRARDRRRPGSTAGSTPRARSARARPSDGGRRLHAGGRRRVRGLRARRAAGRPRVG